MIFRQFARITTIAATIVAVLFAAASAQSVPERSLGEGPYDRLVIRGVTVIDGAGAPPFGPMDVVVEDGRITGIVPVGAPGLPINQGRRPPAGTREIDANGMFLLPGFINMHGHIHNEDTGQGVPPDYIFKLWLAHGITTVRELGNEAGAAWTAGVARSSARNEIDAPNIYPYPVFRGWSAGDVDTLGKAWLEASS